MMSKQSIPPIPQKNFFKVSFSNHREFTSGIILNKPEHGNMTIRELIQLFPISEAPKMKRFYRSRFFKTYSEAFKATPDDIEYSARINP